MRDVVRISQSLAVGDHALDADSCSCLAQTSAIIRWNLLEPAADERDSRCNDIPGALSLD